VKEINSRNRFSRLQLSVFLLIFVAIGGVAIWRSLAASNPNLPGDLNNDNTVNVTDMSILLSNYGTANTSADINGDGTVNVLDMSILLSNYGKTYTPAATLALSSSSIQAGQTLSGTVSWTVTTTGSVASVEFWANNQKLATATASPYTYALDTTKLPNGTNSLGVAINGTNGSRITPQIGSVSVSNVVSPPVSSTRKVYCLGNPAYGVGGFQFDGTSTGWIRQYGSGSTVSFDDSVDAGQSGLGCHALRSEIHVSDGPLYCSSGCQRAQAYSSDSLLNQYGGQPPLNTQRGQTSWYGFSFNTNSGFQVQKSTTNPNWDVFFTWHDSGCGSGCSAPQANINFTIANAQPNGTGGWSYFATPRLDVEAYGGNPADTNWWSDGHRYFTPINFTPGRKYNVQMKVTWGDSSNGALSVWIDGTPVVSATGINTLWQGEGVYPMFQQYRAGNAGITNSTDIYWGGLVQGSSLSDIALP